MKWFLGFFSGVVFTVSTIILWNAFPSSEEYQATKALKRCEAHFDNRSEVMCSRERAALRAIRDKEKYGHVD